MNQHPTWQNRVKAGEWDCPVPYTGQELGARLGQWTERQTFVRPEWLLDGQLPAWTLPMTGNKWNVRSYFNIQNFLTLTPSLRILTVYLLSILNYFHCENFFIVKGIIKFKDFLVTKSFPSNSQFLTAAATTNIYFENFGRQPQVQNI